MRLDVLDRRFMSDERLPLIPERIRTMVQQRQGRDRYSRGSGAFRASWEHGVNEYSAPGERQRRRGRDVYVPWICAVSP